MYTSFNPAHPGAWNPYKEPTAAQLYAWPSSAADPVLNTTYYEINFEGSAGPFTPSTRGTHSACPLGALAAVLDKYPEQNGRPVARITRGALMEWYTDCEKWVIIAIHPSGGAFLMSRPGSLQGIKDYRDILSNAGGVPKGERLQLLSLAQARKTPHLAGREYLD